MRSIVARNLLFGPRGLRPRKLTCELLEDRMLLTVWGPWISESHAVWHQGDPYNSYVPLDADTLGRSDAGCVATAAGQVVNYWKYPQDVSFVSSPEGDSYTTRTEGIQIDGDAQKLDFKDLSWLDSAWSDLPYEETNHEKGVVSFGLGVKYEMDYTSHGSGAYTSRGEQVFGSDLGYASAAGGPWSDAGVQEEVVSNLKKGWPVILSVSRHDARGARVAGHSVVVEGYRDDQDESFYVNLGWGNTANENAWYDLPDLDTPFHDYDLVEWAVYDIYPNVPWGQRFGNARNTSYSPYDIPTEVKDRWKVTINDNSGFSGVATGSGGNVFLASSGALPEQPSSLWAINQFGEKIREISLPGIGNTELGSPVQAPNKLTFVPTDDGDIYRVDLDSGMPGVKIFDGPAQGGIELSVDNAGVLYASYREMLYSMNQDGSVRWAYPMQVAWVPKPAIDIDNNRVFVPRNDSDNTLSYLVMLDRQSGEELDVYPLGQIAPGKHGARHAAVSEDGTVYVGNSGELHELTVTNRNELQETWRSNGLGYPSQQAPSIGKDGTLYFAFAQESNLENRVGAFDPTTHSFRWIIAPEMNEFDFFNTVTVGANDTIAFSRVIQVFGKSPRFVVYAYRDLGATYQELWEKDFGKGGGKLALGAGNVMYVVSAQRSVTAIASGEVGNPYFGGMGWENNTSPNPASMPSPGNGVTTLDTNVLLSWQSEDPDGAPNGAEVTATVFLLQQSGEDMSEYVYSMNQGESSLQLEDLRPQTRYSWRVRLTDGQAVSEGPTWIFSTPPAQKVLLGDVNLDGSMNGLDVDPFVDVLLNGPYQAQADMNQDGVVNGLDTDPFVCVLLGVCNGLEVIEFDFGQSPYTPVVGDWQGDHTDNVGRFVDGTWSLDANGNRSWDGVSGGDLRYEFGAKGDMPVTGDWTGDGSDNIGVYRGTTWLLDANGNGMWDGTAGGDLRYEFGAVGDVPVTGDWTGDGSDNIGVFRDTTWLLDANGNGTWNGTAGGDLLFQFGAVGDVPVTGDWTGDETDKIGVFRDGKWFLDANGSHAWDLVSGGDMQVVLGVAGDKPVVSDWNGNGLDGVGIYRNGTWIVDVSDNHRRDRDALLPAVAGGIGQADVALDAVFAAASTRERVSTRLQQPRHVHDSYRSDDHAQLIHRRVFERVFSRRRHSSDRRAVPMDNVTQRMHQRHVLVDHWQATVDRAFGDGADWIG